MGRTSAPSPRMARRLLGRLDVGGNTEPGELKRRVAFVFLTRLVDVKATPGDGHAASEKAAFQMVIDELDKRSPFKVTDLEVNGHDIMKELGIEEGTLVGTILNALFDQVIDERVDNKHGELIDEARRIHTATSTALAVRT